MYLASVSVSGSGSVSGSVSVVRGIAISGSVSVVRGTEPYVRTAIHKSYHFET